MASARFGADVGTAFERIGKQFEEAQKQGLAGGSVKEIKKRISTLRQDVNAFLEGSTALSEEQVRQKFRDLEFRDIKSALTGGDPVFRSAEALEQKRSLLAKRPGRRQTILTR